MVWSFLFDGKDLVFDVSKHVYASMDLSLFICYFRVLTNGIVCVRLMLKENPILVICTAALQYPCNTEKCFDVILSSLG